MRFDRAMTLQHSFWYQQAAEAFQSVREADPGCTMAHWGEAMTLLLNPFNVPTSQNLQAGQALLAEARRLGARSEREAGYIGALSYGLRLIGSACRRAPALRGSW